MTSYGLLAACVGLLVSLVAPYGVLPLLQRLKVIDIPSARSSHNSPALRGAGLATLAGFVAGCFVLLLAGQARGLVTCVLLTTVAATAVGWLEDFRGLSIRYRVAGQLLIGLGSAWVIAILTGADLWIVPIGGLFITGFTNVANFIDGVDGISGLHGAVFGVTYAVAGLVFAQPWLTSLGLLLAAVYLAFLPWNLGSKRIFLGDSGSYLLGAGTAVIAVVAFSKGVSFLALLGPVAIYLADATFTLLSRVAGGQRWYESHRSHIYHQLEDLGLSHLKVSGIVATASCATGALAILAAYSNVWIGALSLCAIAAVMVAYIMAPARIRRRNVSSRPLGAGGAHHE